MVQDPDFTGGRCTPLGALLSHILGTTFPHNLILSFKPSNYSELTPSTFSEIGSEFSFNVKKQTRQNLHIFIYFQHIGIYIIHKFYKKSDIGKKYKK